MSLVNQETLSDIKSLKVNAKLGYGMNFADKYNVSMEALQMAISLLEQLHESTKNFEFEVKVKQNDRE